MEGQYAEKEEEEVYRKVKVNIYMYMSKYFHQDFEKVQFFIRSLTSGPG